MHQIWLKCFHCQQSSIYIPNDYHTRDFIKKFRVIRSKVLEFSRFTADVVFIHPLKEFNLCI